MVCFSRKLFIASVALMTALPMSAQRFTLEVHHDSLAYIVLNDTDDGGEVLSRWRVPYPTYGFCTGDVNGDGQDEAIVGVVKATRFDPAISRRLFVYKQVEGRIRPLWLGSKLGGFIDDFRFVNGSIRCLHHSDGERWHVVDYQWGTFGPSKANVLIEDATREQAQKIFLKD